MFIVLYKHEKTVNSKIFTSILFSRNFAKCRENKTFAKWKNGEIIQSFTDIGK